MKSTDKICTVTSPALYVRFAGEVEK